jgi:hypothetical protein
MAGIATLTAAVAAAAVAHTATPAMTITVVNHVPGQEERYEQQ